MISLHLQSHRICNIFFKREFASFKTKIWYWKLRRKYRKYKEIAFLWLTIFTIFLLRKLSSVICTKLHGPFRSLERIVNFNYAKLYICKVLFAIIANSFFFFGTRKKFCKYFSLVSVTEISMKHIPPQDGDFVFNHWRCTHWIHYAT